MYDVYMRYQTIFIPQEPKMYIIKEAFSNHPPYP